MDQSVNADVQFRLSCAEGLRWDAGFSPTLEATLPTGRDQARGASEFHAPARKATASLGRPPL